MKVYFATQKFYCSLRKVSGSCDFNDITGLLVKWAKYSIKYQWITLYPMEICCVFHHIYQKKVWNNLSKVRHML